MPNAPFEQPQQLIHILNLIAEVQAVTIKSLSALNVEALISGILHETKAVVKYDRALLFNKIEGKVQILGTYDEKGSDPQPEMLADYRRLIGSLAGNKSPQILTAENFAGSQETWNTIQSAHPSTVFWIPILQGHEELGLWLERFDTPKAQEDFRNYTSIFEEFLIPAYATAWVKMGSESFLRKVMAMFDLKKTALSFLVALIVLFLIPIHLRIVAPCEVVAKNPYVVTAPLDGIIDSIVVEAGEKVKKNQLLFSYDDKLLMTQYKAALRNVERLQIDVNHFYVLGEKNSPENSNLVFLKAKLKKGQDEVDYFKEQLALAIDKSPIEGLVSIDNPLSWRGKPIKIGEKIMVISNPKETMVRIWIPDRDNVSFPANLSIDVSLNPYPEKEFTARLLHISNEAKMGEDRLPYFEAEAEWEDVKESPALGLKGFAVLSGEKVSLIYYLLRKPIAVARKLVGI